MFSGLRTVVYYVADVAKAKAWWSEVLGSTPYFDQPFYVGFNVHGYELGLHPVEPGTSEKVITYWGVADIEAAYRQLLDAGATEHQPVLDVGDGIKVAAVNDPSGNIVGIIDNPHFSLPPA